MDEVRSFDTIEEMQAFMREQEQVAQELVTDQQRRIGYGDYWMRPLGAAYDYAFVFGQVQTEREFVRAEMFGVTLYNDPDELDWADTAVDELFAVMESRGVPWSYPYAETIANLAVELGHVRTGEHGMMAGAALRHQFEMMERGYRFGRAYSVIVPDGEFGSTHVSEMVPLRKEEFEDARKAGWSWSALATPGEPGYADWAARLMIRNETLEQLHAREI